MTQGRPRAGMTLQKLLNCHQCFVKFVPTRSQWKKKSDRVAYCSPICRLAAVRKRLCKEKPQRGPCLQCSSMFFSRYEKKFCSMKCYNSSPQFKQMQRDNYRKGHESRAKNAGKNLTGSRLPCLECGKEIYIQPGLLGKKKYCSQTCYRLYLAKRFDRWIASPQEIAELQNYDEFLSQDVLPCLIAGCSWQGRALGNHLNQGHGVPAEEAKRAAGFNLGTGLVSRDLREVLCERENIGVALKLKKPSPQAREASSKPRDYLSREGTEHSIKSRLLALELNERPIRHCLWCKIDFDQTTPYGKAKYCSLKCRDKHYREKINLRKYPAKCSHCAIEFKMNATQNRAHGKGRPVVCSLSCRNRLNIKVCHEARNVGGVV